MKIGSLVHYFIFLEQSILEYSFNKKLSADSKKETTPAIYLNKDEKENKKNEYFDYYVKKECKQRKITEQEYWEECWIGTEFRKFPKTYLDKNTVFQKVYTSFPDEIKKLFGENK